MVAEHDRIRKKGYHNIVQQIVIGFDENEKENAYNLIKNGTKGERELFPKQIVIWAFITFGRFDFYILFFSSSQFWDSICLVSYFFIISHHQHDYHCCQALLLLRRNVKKNKLQKSESERLNDIGNCLFFLKDFIGNYLLNDFELKIPLEVITKIELHGQAKLEKKMKKQIEWK